ncbi:hypothetical protein KAR91_78440 [Candidatus Pacearchaeota archaeon]|nr:hypothetical protein [Candidatus Pacearchaeota archaeon]
MKAIHSINDGKFLGWLHKEYKNTVSLINFEGIKSKPKVSRGWRKASLKEYQNEA